MSIEIDWHGLTNGADGEALAATIRGFIHERFQQVTLPRFIRSVEVHAFEFGEQAPEVEIKDICDPLPDFYDDSGEEDDSEDEYDTDGAGTRGVPLGGPTVSAPSGQSVDHHAEYPSHAFRPGPPIRQQTVPGPTTQLPPLQPTFGIVDHHLASPVLSRSTTPGLPGSAPAWGYFMPRSGGLGGAASPLSATFGAGATHYPHPWQHYTLGGSTERRAQDHHLPSASAADELHTRPSTATTQGRESLIGELGAEGRPARYDDDDGDLDGATEPHQPRPEPDPNDLQVVLRVSYRGNVRLALTAAILLDYPMPSFVELPLRLTVAGVHFDGVALLAYLGRRKRGTRAHFCFLSPEDARMLVGKGSALDGDSDDGQESQKTAADRSDEIGGLLGEMRIESEIGQREVGKQVLKNVGKVEKFVLEQVRQLFEDELVYPSFYTFLV